MAQGCEGMLDGVGEDNTGATVLTEIDELTGKEYAIDRGLVLAHEGLVPGVLKVKNTEVCAYELAPQGSEPILLCKPLKVWMEDPAAQIICWPGFIRSLWRDCILGSDSSCLEYAAG